MELKKTEKANLEKKKGIFLQLGLIVVLSLVLIAFEWTSTHLRGSEFGALESINIEEEIIPITRQKEIEPPKLLEPPKVIEKFDIVDDDLDVEDVIIDDIEADQDTEFQIMEFFEEEEEEGEESFIFTIVEDMPMFGGGDQNKFRQYIQKTLKYPPIAAENGIQGTVYINFVVNRNGEVANATIIRGVDPALDKEAVRVIMSSPKWTPGKQRGKPVRVQFTFPIKFVLQ